MSAEVDAVVDLRKPVADDHEVSGQTATLRLPAVTGLHSRLR